MVMKERLENKSNKEQVGCLNTNFILQLHYRLVFPNIHTPFYHLRLPLSLPHILIFVVNLHSLSI